jgi:hypothetical protein
MVGLFFYSKKEHNLNMANHFTKLDSYLKQFRSRYFEALNAFYLFDAIEKSKAPNLTSEAYENVKIMKFNNTFFVMTRHALNYYFLIELAKMFDEVGDSLGINKIINFVDSNKKQFTKSEFLIHNATRPFADELAKRYRRISNRELLALRKLLNKNQALIAKVIKYRNQNLAHDDINKKKIAITKIDILKLFKILDAILKKFYYKFDFSVSSFINIEKDCNESFKHLLENLKKAESYRLKEIEEKYNVKLS